MKLKNLLLSSVACLSLAIMSSCNSNQKEEEKLDTVFENTDPEGHPLDNRDTVIEYKETDSVKSDTSLRGDKH